MLRRIQPHRVGPRVAALLGMGVALLAGTPAGAPILNRSILKSFYSAGPGTTATHPRACDTEILLTYTAGLAGMTSGSGAATALFLFDSNGEPLTSGTGQVVCAPCLYQTGGSAPRRTSIVIDDLIMARGGFGTSGQTQQGFAVLDATGDADHLSAEFRIKTTTGTAGQPSIVPVLPADILKDYFETSNQPRVYVASKLDGISDWDVSDWAIFHATYGGGIGSLPAGGGAMLEVYLFNDDGSPQGGLTSPVCAPCSYALGSGGTSGAPRNVDLRFPPAPTASGEGFAVFRVAGADPSAVVIEQTDVDSIPGAIPTVRIMRSQALDALGPPSGSVAVNEPDMPGAALVLRGSPNPTAGGMTFAFDLARATSVDLQVFDAAGRRVATVSTGMRAAGHHEVRWNRSDSAGHSLAAGVYYGRLRASDGSRITRLVFLPE